MKKSVLILTLFLVVTQSWAQLQRSDEFHAKYKLKEVVVFSRHGIRAPNSGSQIFMSSGTSNTWVDFTAPVEQLTLKGGVLETQMGQFFRKWTASEGLLSENIYTPETEDSIFFYANSMQRTIATSRYFLAGFMPVSSLSTSWTGTFGTFNREFKPQLFDVNDTEKVMADIAYMNERDTLRKISEGCAEGMKILADVLDFKNSPICQSGEIPDFGTNPDHNMTYTIDGDEVSCNLTSLVISFLLADPLILQSYITGDSTAFGKPLTYEQWRSIGKICDAMISVYPTLPSIYKPAAQHMLDSISAELKNEDRKFFFMCGHDANIVCILNGMGVEDYTLENAIEPRIPIGSKIVFEKWEDASGKEYIGLNFVYQSVDQMRKGEILTLSNPPMVKALKLKTLPTNEDGLYPFREFTDLIDNVNTAPVADEIKQAESTQGSATYNIQGQKVNSAPAGTILITDGKKVLSR